MKQFIKKINIFQKTLLTLVFLLLVSISSGFAEEKEKPILDIGPYLARLEKEMLPRETPAKTPVFSISSKKRQKKYHPIIEKVAKRHQLDPALIKAIIMAESSYNPYAVSKVGAKGLMQLMPATAKALGVKEIFNPEHNISGGVKYFKELLIHFDWDVKLALAAYNAGITNVRKYRGVPPYGATKSYIRKVIMYYWYYKTC